MASRVSRASRASVALAAASALFVTLVPVGSGAPSAGAAPIDIYAFANGCYALKDESSGRFVSRDALGFLAGATNAAAATSFRMQATALGRYMLYGTGGNMIATGLLNSIPSTTSPGPTADWAVADVAGRLRLTSVSTGKNLGVGLLRRLGQSTASEARWSLLPAQGCAVFPEIEINANGTPFTNADPDAPVRGFLDAHTHVSGFEFLGGRFHCGRPWSPYGVDVALTDCPDHGINGETAIFENFISTGNPIGLHNTDGWPSFAGWPRHDSLTHESTYWKWIERAWRGGLRIMVNDLVENRALCEIYPLKQNDCNEMVSVRHQAADMFALQDYIDAQFGGPGKGFFRIVLSPTEARHVINSGKLAVVLGVEVSEVLDCGVANEVPNCTADQVDQRIVDLHDLGVRSFFPVHKFDNAFGGTHFDDDATGLLVNVGNKYATGKWWQAVPCAPGADADNTPTNLSGNNQILYQLFGQTIGGLLNGDVPAYPPAPICNPHGLTALGAHLLAKMIELGMIIETDHMSVKARSEALSVLEAAGYSGLISSHGWGDSGSQVRLQQLGGVVAPYARDATEYVSAWQQARATRDPDFCFGVGYGSDNNGLGAQPGPRPGNAANPVTYPYTTFDGGTVMDKQHSGTRVYDINVDGVAHYGLFPDYIEDLRHIAGDQIVDDMANGAEAYLQMWERALS